MTQLPTAMMPPSRPSRAYLWVHAHTLLTFFSLAFLLTWAILIPLTLASWGLFVFPASLPLLVLMGYGPALAAVLVSWLVGGRVAIRHLLGRLLIWRVGWGWYVVALLLNGALILSALGLYSLVGGVVTGWPAIGPSLLLDSALTFVIVSVVNGEEIGWRGFALPRMQARWGMSRTVLLLGTMEAIFHLPTFFNQGPSEAGGQAGMAFAPFWVSSVAAVLLMTWLYNNTSGSLLLAYLFHGSMNAWTNILPFPSTSASFFWCLAGTQCVVCAVVVVSFGTTRLSRKPMSAMPFSSDPQLVVVVVPSPSA